MADDEECYDYLPDYPNLTILHNEYHRGFATARNKGLEYILGKWVMFLDHDDRLTEKVLPELRKADKNGFHAAHFLVTYDGKENVLHSFAGHHGLAVTRTFIYETNFRFPYQLTSSEDLYYNRFVHANTEVYKIHEQGYKWIAHDRNSSGLTYGGVGFFEWNFAAHIYAELLVQNNKRDFFELFLECIISIACVKKFEDRGIDDAAYIAMDCLLIRFREMGYTTGKLVKELFGNYDSRRFMNAEAQARAFYGNRSKGDLSDIIPRSPNNITKYLHDVIGECEVHLAYAKPEVSLDNVIIMDDSEYENIDPKTLKDKPLYITTNGRNPKLERLKYLIRKGD